MKILSAILTIGVLTLAFMTTGLLDDSIVLILLVIAFVVGFILRAPNRTPQQKDIGSGILIGSTVSLLVVALIFIWLMTTQFK